MQQDASVTPPPQRRTRQLATLRRHRFRIAMQPPWPAEAVAVLEATTDAFFSLDAAWRFTYLNRHAEAYLRQPAEALLGTVIWDAFPQMVGSPTWEHLTRAMRERVPLDYEVVSRLTGHWVEGHVHPRADGIAVFFRDISRRRKLEETLRFLDTLSDTLAASLEYRDTLQNIARLVVGTLADGCIVHAEEGGRIRSFGVAHVDSAREAALRDLLRELSTDTGAATPVATVLRTGEPLLAPEVDDELLCASAARADQVRALRGLGIVSGMIVPMRTRGRTLGALTLFRDAAGGAYNAGDLALAEEVARRAAVAADNTRLYDQARAAIHARDDVLGIVSHDLRNPINAIVLSATMLQEMVSRERWNESETRMVDVIRHAADQMNTLIVDLLEVTNLEQGRPILVREPTSVSTIFDAVLEMFLPLAAEQGVSLHAAAGAALRVEVDYGRTLQIFSNLMGNAIKFTPAGGEIRIGTEIEGEMLRIEVTDTGAGIAEEHLPHVFDRFWQARSTGRAGAGLGLAICRALVLAHGGRIGVASTPGQGSTFTFTLPLAGE